jgi:ATP synthase protein I
MRDRKSPKSGESDRYQGVRNIGVALTIPMMMAASALVGCGIGYYLDRWLKTSPWLLLLFLVLGFGAGLRETIALIRRISDKDA